MSKQKKVYPGSTELVCWKANWKDSEIRFFLEFVFRKFPILTEAGREISAEGKDWSGFMPADMFRTRVSERGVAGLSSYIFRELDPSIDVRIVRRGPNECDRLNILCSQHRWNTAGGDDMVSELLAGVEVDYGHLNSAKYFNIDQAHRVAASPTFGSERFVPWQSPKNNKLLSASSYESLLSLWEEDHGIGEKNPTELVSRPLLVYPTSILTKQHLSIPMNRNLDFGEWISADPMRGTLTRLNDVNTLWVVLPEKIEMVTRTLWDMQFFRAQEYFEIGGWDRDLNLPRFRHVKQLEDI